MGRPEECFTTLQSSHLVYHSKANNGQAGVGCSVHNKALQTKDIASFAPTTSYSEERHKYFLQRHRWDLRETKPLHDSDGRMQCSNRGKWTNPMETAMFQKKAGRRWTWKSPNGVTKTEIDYILTNRPDIVKDITVINQVNTGSDHRLVISNIKLDVEVEYLHAKGPG